MRDWEGPRTGNYRHCAKTWNKMKRHSDYCGKLPGIIMDNSRFCDFIAISGGRL
jgi:hypothetical protein